MSIRKKKRRINAMSKAYHESRRWMSEEEYAWEFMRPVGREFGSSDYQRLAKLDALADQAKASGMRTAAAIDDVQKFVEESNQRILKMEQTQAVSKKLSQE